LTNRSRAKAQEKTQERQKLQRFQAFSRIYQNPHRKTSKQCKAVLVTTRDVHELLLNCLIYETMAIRPERASGNVCGFIRGGLVGDVMNGGGRVKRRNNSVRESMI